MLGIKIKFPKSEYAKKKEQSPFYYYKKNNIEITKLPKASGQLRDIQLANLSILIEFDKICKENNLQYWLWAGTVLGAVRHKGFIPWDDDIDVAMPRNDYEKFIDIFNNSNCGDLYARLCDEEIDSMSFLTKIKHKKTNHLFLDIFAVDFCGENYSKENQFLLTKKIKTERNKLKKELSGLKTSKRLEKIKEFRQKYTDNSKTHSDIIMGLEWGHIEQNWFVSYMIVSFR